MTAHVPAGFRTVPAPGTTTSAGACPTGVRTVLAPGATTYPIGGPAR